MIKQKFPKNKYEEPQVTRHVDDLHANRIPTTQPETGVIKCPVTERKASARLIFGYLRRVRNEKEPMPNQALESNESCQSGDAITQEADILQDMSCWDIIPIHKDVRDMHSNFIPKRNRDPL